MRTCSHCSHLALCTSIVCFVSRCVLHRFPFVFGYICSSRRTFIAYWLSITHLATTYCKCNNDKFKVWIWLNLPLNSMDLAGYHSRNLRSYVCSRDVIEILFLIRCGPREAIRRLGVRISRRCVFRARVHLVIHLPSALQRACWVFTATFHCKL